MGPAQQLHRRLGVARARERLHAAGVRTILRIGRAGERQVTYASVIAETYRHFGRLGLGAVFGSKQLKALVIGGRRSLPVADRKAYRTVYDEIFKAATESPLMKKYHELGTAMNVVPLNEIGALPTRNLQAGRFENAEAISGERLAEAFLGRRVACAHCPVACIHLAALRTALSQRTLLLQDQDVGLRPRADLRHGQHAGHRRRAGDAAPDGRDGSAGAGRDERRRGAGLGHRGLQTRADHDRKRPTDWTLAFGDAENYIAATQRIVSQPTDFYRALARGVEHAASIYGGAEFALAFGGNEMPGYHTGPACHLGYLTGARHSHLDSAGYSLDQKAAAKGEALTPDGVADALLNEERWRQVLTSLVVCFFARGVYTEDVVLKALAVAGFNWSADELTRLGAQTLRRKNDFKAREGFDLAKVRIPRRILETPSPLGTVDEAFMRQAMARFAETM